MDKEIYELLYALPNGTEDYASDLTEVDIKDVPQERIVKLKELLNDKNEQIALIAARILCSWGDEDGFNYLEKFVLERPVLEENWLPHRLRGYDDTYKHILRALIRYWTSHADSNSGEIARRKIAAPITKIISMSNAMPFEIDNLFWLIREEGFAEFIPAIKKHLTEILKNEALHHWKINDCVNFLKKLDLPFVEELLKQHGKTLADYPETLSP